MPIQDPTHAGPKTFALKKIGITGTRVANPAVSVLERRVANLGLVSGATGTVIRAAWR